MLLVILVVLEVATNMASYCECGHVLAMHTDIEFNDYMQGFNGPQFCLDPDGCDCEGFEEIPSEVLDRG